MGEGGDLCFEGFYGDFDASGIDVEVGSFYPLKAVVGGDGYSVMQGEPCLFCGRVSDLEFSELVGFDLGAGRDEVV